MAKKDDNKPTEREKKYQKKVAQEKKKLDKIVRFPPKAVLLLSIIVGLMSFIFAYFGGTSDAITAILTAFFYFSIAFIGLGITMMIFFFLKSEQIKKEYELQIIKERQDKEYEEQQRFKSEINELENIERELSEKKAKAATNSKRNESPKKTGMSMSDEEAYLDEVLNSNFKP